MSQGEGPGFLGAGPTHSPHVALNGSENSALGMLAGDTDGQQQRSPLASWRTRGRLLQCTQASVSQLIGS